MDLITKPLDIFSSLLIFFLGFILIKILSKSFKIKPTRAIIIYIWHSLFCIIYANYVIKNGGDAIWYYQLSLQDSFNLSLGTYSVVIITSFFSSFLNLSLLATFLAFNILGSIGLLAFDSCLRAITFNKSKFIRILCTIIVFLPSISFWTSGIGKDSIAFMAIGLALWSSTQKKKHYWILIISIFLMLVVRPHISALMTISFAASILIQQKISFLKRFILTLIGIILAVTLIPLAIDTSGLSDLDNLNQYIIQRQSYNQEGGGGIDITSMPLALKLFTYLFRPLPFEANNLFSLAASVDNIILLCLFLSGLFHILKYKKQDAFDNTFFLWIYVITTWLILSLTTANLGISLRQKWMFTPILIYLLISAINRKHPLINSKSIKKNIL